MDNIRISLIFYHLILYMPIHLSPFENKLTYCFQNSYYLKMSRKFQSLRIKKKM
jgi:hypothetical protein